MKDINIYNNKLKVCSKKPVTGFKRDGYCRSDVEDSGKHLICAKIDEKFLKYTAAKGNNLYSVVNPGDKWCICENRYYEAYKDNNAPIVIKNASSSNISPHIKNVVKSKTKKRSGGKIIPQLRKLTKKSKKYIYRLYDPQNKRILAINEGVNNKNNKTYKSKRDAAKMKKARFNILRLYRKNTDKKGCRNLTNDMIYIDKKYNLGSTKKICGGHGNNLKIAYFSAGCFWSVQKKFNNLKGVISTDVGYMGGKIINPTYDIVCGGNTDYAETIRIKYNKNVISYKKLIEFFFKIHDPTSLNRQGLDIGRQYRSIVFYNNKNEKKKYLDFLNTIANKDKIVTELLSAKKFKFYKAEDFHQNYLDKKGGKKIKKTKTNKKQFLYNPDNPEKSFDVYIDKNPHDTINIKYTTIDDIKSTIKKLERLYKTKKYSHKRIWQVGMIMKVRLEAMLKHRNSLYPNAKNVKTRFNLADKYFKFLSNRTKKMTFKERKTMKFKL